MLSQEIQAPNNWSWSRGNILTLAILIDPADTYTNEHDPWRDTFLSFFSWLEENDLKAIGYDRNTFQITVEGQSELLRYQFPAYYSFEIYRPGDWPYGSDEHIVNTEFFCGNCGNSEHKYSSLFCHNPECDSLFYCMNCRRFRDSANFDITSAMTHCVRCGSECSCGRYHSGYLAQCATCEPVFQCGNCGGHSTGDPHIVMFSNTEIKCCSYCHSTFCVSCEQFTPDALDDDRVCERCNFLGKDGDKEVFDDKDTMASTKLTLPTIPGREMIRLSGVEIEGGLGKTRISPSSGLTGPNALARALYDNGLSGNYQQVGYHHGEGFARVETDASCDWECVIGPINMANYEDVKRLNKVVKIIKQHIKDDLLKLDLRCGTHIHIGADKVSLGQAYNLHLIYTFMEDVLYRLGAANWPVHRILINDESHSAKRSPKQSGKTRFARTFHAGEARYYGLSFSNYFERMLSECNCGAARYGAYEECTCDLHKCTFEFRLFNSTANTIKLHAYLALSQALVSKAISMPEIKDPNVFEEFPFVTQRFRDMSPNLQSEMIHKWDSRLRYIATELPLTDDEKKSIYYCIKNSELVKVDGMKELFTESEVN